MSGPKSHLLPPPLPISDAAVFRTFQYRGSGSVRHAYHILLNLSMGDFVTSIVYDRVSHCNVTLRVPSEHIDRVCRTLGIPN
jgi:hypothetical protein